MIRMGPHGGRSGPAKSDAVEGSMEDQEALDLAADLPDIAVVRLIEPGFDNAVEHVRLTSDARTVVFVDLSADLRDQLAQVESAGR